MSDESAINRHEREMEAWKAVCSQPLYQFLKFDPVGRRILELLADEQISMGKAAQAITEKFCLDIEPILPEINDKGGWLYDPDAKMAEVRAKMQPPAPDWAKPIAVNTPTCDKCGKNFLECQCQQIHVEPSAGADWAEQEAREWLEKNVWTPSRSEEDCYSDLQTLIVLLRRVAERQRQKDAEYVESLIVSDAWALKSAGMDSAFEDGPAAKKLVDAGCNLHHLANIVAAAIRKGEKP